MPTPSHRRLRRALTLTVAFAVLAAIVCVTRPSDTAHPPERIATTTSTVPRYTGPATDPHHELVVAVEAAQRAAFFEWASSQPPPPTTTPRATSRNVPTDTAPAPSGDALTAIAAHFPDLYDEAVGVAHCESTLDPGAISGPNFGLFQISTVHRDDFEQFTGRSWEAAILDADANAAYARKLYDGHGGWGPWACRWAAG